MPRSVFLAGPFAYKVKQLVKYPFSTFSSLDRRRSALLNELRINRRTARTSISTLFPITAGKGGEFRLGGAGRRSNGRCVCAVSTRTSSTIASPKAPFHCQGHARLG